MSDERAGEAGPDGVEIARRKAFLEIGEHDVQRLTELHRLIEANEACAFFVDRFYEHLLSFEETARLIADEATFDRLKQTQAEYFHTLLAGRYDENYVRHRLRVGAAHERVGLEVQWYLGAYSKYLGLLIPQCVEQYGGDHQQALKTLGAVLKVIFLDVGLAVDTYIQAKERSIHAQAAQLRSLNKVALAINTTLSLDQASPRIIQCGMDLIGAEGACLGIYDERRGGFERPTAINLSDELLDDLGFEGNGLAGDVLRGGTLVHRNATPKSPRALSAAARRAGVQAIVCLPLFGHQRPLGVLCFCRFHGGAFSTDEIDLVRTFSKLASQALENAVDYADVADQALTDRLTRLPNRRAFEGRLTEQWQRITRYGGELTLAIVDIDKFKNVNDTFGHGAGDAVLAEVARRIEQACRDVDFAARYGGEEFAVILPDTGGEGAKAFGRRLREAIGAAPFALPNGADIAVTASVGLVVYPLCTAEKREMVEKADQALYVAKRSGRNRDVLYCDTLKAELEGNPHWIVTLLNETLDNVPAIVEALGTKTPYFRAHPEEVERLALRLGDRLGLSADALETLSQAAWLHDIGIVYVPDKILNKPAAFTEESEWAAVRHHPAEGAALLEQVPALAPVATIVRHHHERYDGSGYPDGLRGEAIPYLARVLAVADAFSAMTEDQPFRRAMDVSEVLRVLEEEAGRQFDPRVVAALLDLLGETRVGQETA